MSHLPIFVATHPRACSTAFERVFMTRRDTIKCEHEPFGDAYYYGPERLAVRYADNEKARLASGYSQSTYQTIMDTINQHNTEGKRIFIKDMAQYLMPPSRKPVSIAPSLLTKKKGVGTDDEVKRNGTSVTNGEVNGYTNGHTNGATNGHTNGDVGTHFDTQTSIVRGDNLPADEVNDAPYNTLTEMQNPTIMPTDLLEQFHFAFLIRHPRYAIPSYYRCCIPPLEEMTGFHGFRPDEAGYDELVRLFDYLRSIGHIGPEVADKPDSYDTVDGQKINGNGSKIQICVIDADDLLDDPEGMIRAFCKSTGIDYDPDMLNWNTEEEHALAAHAFEKWKGFHEDVINSSDLHARDHKHIKTDEQQYADWVQRFGEKGAKVIRRTVDENVRNYEHLAQFAIRP